MVGFTHVSGCLTEREPRQGLESMQVSSGQRVLGGGSHWASDQSRPMQSMAEWPASEKLDVTSRAAALTLPTLLGHPGRVSGCPALRGSLSCRNPVLGKVRSSRGKGTWIRGHLDMWAPGYVYTWAHRTLGWAQSQGSLSVLS